MDVLPVFDPPRQLLCQAGQAPAEGFGFCGLYSDPYDHVLPHVGLSQAFAEPRCCGLQLDCTTDMLASPPAVVYARLAPPCCFLAGPVLGVQEL